MKEGELAEPADLEKRVIEALHTVYDPEIPVDIFELGLVYAVEADPSGTVAVRMTLTSPGCPAAQELPATVEQRVREVPGVVDAKVEVVFDPPWCSDRMTEAAKLQLGML
jgi:FeS assembly SUF system protein